MIQHRLPPEGLKEISKFYITDQKVDTDFWPDKKAKICRTEMARSYKINGKVGSNRQAS